MGIGNPLKKIGDTFDDVADFVKEDVLGNPVIASTVGYALFGPMGAKIGGMLSGAVTAQQNNQNALMGGGMGWLAGGGIGNLAGQIGVPSNLVGSAMQTTPSNFGAQIGQMAAAPGPHASVELDQWTPAYGDMPESFVNSQGGVGNKHVWGVNPRFPPGGGINQIASPRNIGPIPRGPIPREINTDSFFPIEQEGISSDLDLSEIANFYPKTNEDRPFWESDWMKYGTGIALLAGMLEEPEWETIDPPSLPEYKPTPKSARHTFGSRSVGRTLRQV
jgi:hypothetical protein